MSITDHVAILLHSSLDQAKANKANPNKIEFYANLAFPPAAGNDMAATMKEVAPNGSLNGLRLTVEANNKKAKPHVGIPDDWLIVRMASGPDFPPDLYAESGNKITALPVNGAQIRGEFYAGQKVRVNGFPYFWTHKDSGARGVSWNLSGLMAVGGGERRASSGEPSETAFAAYRGPGAEEAAPAPNTQSNAPTQTGGAAGSNNPFQQTGSAAANPFV